MAVYAFGADYDGRDVFSDFIANDCVGIGWSYKNNTSGHHLVKSIKAGDIVYIKKCNVGSDITVRAIGIITDYELNSLPNIAEIARNVKWLYKTMFIIPNPKNSDKNNVRSNCVYEEFNLDVINRIVEKFVLV